MRMEPAHPGELIQECYIDERGVTITEIAKKLKVSPSTLSRIIQGKASVTPDMAVRLERVLGGSAESWMRMQVNYDLWHVEAKNSYLELQPI